MAYILFILNFCINWCVLFIVMAFTLEHFYATWTMVAIITTIMLVGIIIFFSTSGAKYLKTGISYRLPNQYEIGYLNPILKEVFEKSCLKKTPSIFIQDEAFPNAMVVGDSMIITTGLLKIANRNEVAAVIAHECGHIVNNDLIFATINYATNKLSDIALWAGVWLITIISLNGRIPFLYLPYIMIAGILRFIRWILLKSVDLSSRAYYRKREYRADKFAADIGYKEATISWFKKLNDLYPEIKKSTIFCSHPSTIKRLKALNAEI